MRWNYTSVEILSGRERSESWLELRGFTVCEFFLIYSEEPRLRSASNLCHSSIWRWTLLWGHFLSHKIQWKTLKLRILMVPYVLCNILHITITSSNEQLSSHHSVSSLCQVCGTAHPGMQCLNFIRYQTPPTNLLKTLKLGSCVISAGDITW